MNSSKFNHVFFFTQTQMSLSFILTKKKKKEDCALIGKEYYYTFRKFQRKVVKHQIEH